MTRIVLARVGGPSRVTGDIYTRAALEDLAANADAWAKLGVTNVRLEGENLMGDMDADFTLDPPAGEASPGATCFDCPMPATTTRRGRPFCWGCASLLDDLKHADERPNGMLEHLTRDRPV